MNIIAEALHHEGFATWVVKLRPTMSQFFELAVAGEVPDFAEGQPDVVRMRDGVAIVGRDPRAAQARFVVLPVSPWSRSLGTSPRRARASTGTWAHVRPHSDFVIIVPDDGAPTFNVALFHPQRVSAATTALTSVRFEPRDLSIVSEEERCQPGYEDVGPVSEPICIPNGCPGRCEPDVVVDDGVLTYECCCQ
jgi:hypothetical protein